MQIETQHTITRKELNSDHNALDLCYHPLEKLRLVSDIIDTLENFNEERFHTIHELIEDSVNELESIIDAANRQLKTFAFQSSAGGESTSRQELNRHRAKQDAGAGHIEGGAR
jgi:hypothetical protein